MSFTGSTETGKKVMAGAAEALKRVTLELGGNDAAIVLEGGDPKEIAPKIFSGAIDRVSTISDGKSRAVKLTLHGNTMTLSANSPESGSATEDLEIHGNDNMEIGFNARYLLDITSQIEGDGCRIRLADAASPTIIQDTSDASALYVLMPLRV